jgi:putative oxygen-independent coproporphyrinogen III oxidase
MSIFSRRIDKKPLGIYVHIPFCKSKCQYCDFYSLACKDDNLMDSYLDAVCAHIKEAGSLAPNYKVDTIYFGGGTPSYFGGDAIAIIMTAIRRCFDVTGDAEITFEANPDSVTDKLLHRMRAEGFNRVSLGVQDNHDAMLKKLGRPHTYAQTVNAFQKIRKAGFRNVSLDLMYGLPGQTLTEWQETLNDVLRMNPEHCSCYGLKIEEGTPFYDMKDVLNLPDDDTQADMYLAAVEILRDRGFRQYEVSNFARKGLYSRHNYKYWTGGEYLGFGPSASSDFAGKRFTLIADLQGYINGIRTGGDIMDDIQEIPLRERAGEYIMLRLRTNGGVDPQEYENTYMLPFAPLEAILRKHETYGRAVQNADGRWALTPKGYLVSNDIISDLLIAQDKAGGIKRG